jgi:hypothetical protein
MKNNLELISILNFWREKTKTKRALLWSKTTKNEETGR